MICLYVEMICLYAVWLLWRYDFLVMTQLGFIFYRVFFYGRITVGHLVRRVFSTKYSARSLEWSSPRRIVSWSFIVLNLCWYLFSVKKIFKGKKSIHCFPVQPLTIESFYFRSKYFFEMKVFSSVVGVFFPFPEIAHDAKICRVGVLYNTCVGCHRDSEAGVGWFESRYRSYFFTLF